MALLDKKALELLRARNPKFLETVFKETNPYLIKILASKKIFHNEAHDIIQDSWQIFFEKIEEFKGESQIKTFVAGILINKVREKYRYDKKMIPEEDHEKIFAQAFTHDGWWIHQPHSPHHLMESSEIMKFIEDCLESLSESQKEAFSLKEIDEDSTENICNILGISVTHLGVLIFRAKDKMRKCMEGKMGET